MTILCLTKVNELISPYYHIYASVNWAIIGSDNGLSPILYKAITWTNAALLSIGFMGKHFSEIWTRILFYHFHSRKCI